MGPEVGIYAENCAQDCLIDMVFQEDKTAQINHSSTDYRKKGFAMTGEHIREVLPGSELVVAQHNIFIQYR